MLFTTRYVAIEPVPFTKVESKVEGGFARIKQKVDLIECNLVMGFVLSIGNNTELLKESQVKALLDGDAGLQPWNKQVFEHNGKKFVKCPINEIVAWSKNEV